ncbi:MAG: FxsA family protein [Pseudomonadota bacterium]
MRLFLLLVAVPVIEIALFIEIGGLIGTWETVGVVVLTALIGSILLRQQGLAALQSVQHRLAAGENPGKLLADGAMILVAGALLLTPGFFTDAVGFALLVPPVRDALWRALEKRIHLVSIQTTHSQGPRRPGSAETVDGVYEIVEPDDGPGDPARPSTPVRRP